MKNGVYYVLGGDYLITVSGVRKVEKYGFEKCLGWVCTVDDDLFISHGVFFTENDFNTFIYIGDF